MVKAGAIDKGMCFLIKDEPYQVTEREFVKPGKGAAFVRVKLKNLISGQVLREVYKSQETLEEVDIETRDVQYLYADNLNYVFMDTETYEHHMFPIKDHEEKGFFIKEGDLLQLSFWNEKPLDIIVPYKIVLAVSKAEHALKGDTVSGATKTVTLETGLKVKVPLFIKEGDKILINTETREYVERAG